MLIEKLNHIASFFGLHPDDVADRLVAALDRIEELENLNK